MVAQPDTNSASEQSESAPMQSSSRLKYLAALRVALGLLCAGTACTQNNNAGPNKPANATYGTGQALPHPPSAGVGPQNAWPAGSQ